MSRRRGFTIIEMLMVMIVIGILAALATLRYIDLRNHAVAARIARDVQTVQLGAYNHWADHNGFPPEAAAGVVPPAMVSYLPTNFPFEGPGFTYDWDNFGPDAEGYMVGLTITVSDARLRSSIQRYFGNKLPFFMAGDAVTYVIVGPDGRM